ncbi:hypothetical protein [Paraburkholderia sp. BCC1885]|uniref:hypothetical protein n=1 Tax=Paraburkholderia sp. BCC1885 TaxID=2562669 RepID=UPI0011845ADF|nr:hypothetical protein [Paraburkholderia sp. BCC1885]
MHQPTRLKPLFHPGRLRITASALSALRSNGIPVISVVLRHIVGDWGSLSDEDCQQNDVSIATGLRLLSLYCLPDGARLLVVTEWDRSHTTIRLVDDVLVPPASRQSQPRQSPIWHQHPVPPPVRYR